MNSKNTKKTLKKHNMSTTTSQIYVQTACSVHRRQFAQTLFTSQIALSLIGCKPIFYCFCISHLYLNQHVMAFGSHISLSAFGLANIPDKINHLFVLLFTPKEFDPNITNASTKTPTWTQKYKPMRMWEGFRKAGETVRSRGLPFREASHSQRRGIRFAST